MSFKPKLSNDVQVRFFKKDERGEFYIIGVKGRRDYLKIHGVGKEIVDMLDGNTSVGDIVRNFKAKDVEADVEKFIDLLAEKGFLENRPVPTGERKKTSSVLIHYIPLFKRTDWLLKRIYSIFHGLFYRKLFLLLIMANFAAFSIFLLSILFGSMNINELFFLRNSVVWAITIYTFAIMPFLIAIHEFSHALICYHYGGKPQEMGLALFIFLPFFYADTTDTWMLNKRQSIMVFLAGPLSTFFIGNSFFLLSFAIPQPYSGLFRMVAFGSYLTVLMGFNPLMESDGYFILQTLTDFPNLIAHARKYIPLWFKSKIKHLSSEDQEQMEAYSKKERRILAIYAPSTFLISAVFVVIMGYWGILFAIDYTRIILSIKETIPNITLSILFEFGMQTVYLALMTLFLASTVRRLKTSAKQPKQNRRASSETENNAK